MPIDRDRAARADRGAHVDDQAEPRAVRAAPRRGAAALGRARPQPDQRRHRATRDRARGRAVSARTGSGEWPGSTRAFRPGCGGCCRGASAATTREHRQFIPWREMEPFVGHVPTSRLKLALAPAGAASPGADRRPGRGRLARGGRGDPRGGRRSDKELEADVFEELDDEHQVEFLRERSDEQVAERARADGQRRRRRPAARARPGPPPADPQPAAAGQAAQDHGACSATTRRPPAG